MDNPGLPEKLWAELDGGIWHATDREGFSAIAQSGVIKVSEADRYQNSFCRQLGAVSLFDFGPTARDEWNQFNNWHQWLGSRDQRIAVWCEIDRGLVAGCLKNAGDTHKAWLERVSLRVIPGVEACHIGPISTLAIRNVLLIDYHNKERFLMERPNWHDPLLVIEDFDRSLPPAAPEHPLTKTLREATERQRQISSTLDTRSTICGPDSES